MPKDWTQSLVIPLPRKGSLCQNYRTTSLISYPIKTMLRVFLNRLKAKAEELLAEQAGVKPGRNTVEDFISSQGIIEKLLQHHCGLSHNFMDFKMASDRVWHAGLWQVPMK